MIKYLKWPFVNRKTYDALLLDYDDISNHYWRQGRVIGGLEVKVSKLEAELEKVKKLNIPPEQC